MCFNRKEVRPPRSRFLIRTPYSSETFFFLLFKYVIPGLFYNIQMIIKYIFIKEIKFSFNCDNISHTHDKPKEI